MYDEKRVFLWHDCLNCKDIYEKSCPLKGEYELEKINDRIKRPDDFCCDRFLSKREEFK